MKSILVKDYMKKKVVTFKRDTDILFAMKMLLQGDVSGAPVVDDNVIVGMLSEKDCLRVGIDYSFNRVRPGFVENYMNPNPETVGLTDSIVDIASKFFGKNYRSFPVVDSDNDDKLVGLISRKDVVRAVLDFMKE